MAVLFDVGAPSPSGSVAFTATAVSLPVTIGSLANRAAQLHLTFAANNASGIACDVGGGSFPGALVTGTDSGVTAAERTVIYAVTAPPSGSQTAHASWTNAITADLGIIAASGVDQTTPVNNGTFTAAASSGATTASVTVTSNSGDLTASCSAVYNDGLTGTNRTLKWGIDSSVTGGDIGPGTGTTTHTWTRPFATDAFSISGANFKAAGGSVVFRPEALKPRPFMPSQGFVR